MAAKVSKSPAEGEVEAVSDGGELTVSLPSPPLSILSILPNAVFLLVALLRVNFLRKKPSRLHKALDILLAFKLIFGLLFIGASGASLAKLKDLKGLPGTTIPSAALQLVASVSLKDLLEKNCTPVRCSVEGR